MIRGVVDGVGMGMMDVVVVVLVVVETVDEVPSLSFLDMNVRIEFVVRTTPIVVVVVADGGSNGTLSSKPRRDQDQVQNKFTNFASSCLTF